MGMSVDNCMVLGVGVSKCVGVRAGVGECDVWVGVTVGGRDCECRYGRCVGVDMVWVWV